MVNIKKTNKEITQKLTRIENTLKRKLLTFYNSNIKGSILPTEAIRNKLNNQVKNMIRATVQEAYFKGSDLVTKQITDINDNFEVFISVTDINNIAALTEKLNNQFWKTADRLHRRENEFTFIPGSDLIPKQAFDIAAAMIGMGAYVAFSAFNNAVISKLQVLTQPVANTNVLLATGELSLETVDLTNLKGKVMFLTQEDAKVDPEICEPLNRTVYDASDFDIPEPPLHNHCRCRLVPIVDEFSSEPII